MFTSHEDISVENRKRGSQIGIYHMETYHSYKQNDSPAWKGHEMWWLPLRENCKMKHECVNLQLKTEQDTFRGTSGSFSPAHTSEGVCPQQMNCISVEENTGVFEKALMISNNDSITDSTSSPAKHTNWFPPPSSTSVELGATVQKCSCCLQQREAEMFRFLAGHFDFHIKLLS